MRDSEVVASIVAGDPQGLATAYDRYADPLYTYCRSVLRDPAGAADAVQDTFVVAASRLDGLRDPEKLRSWLYAVARNECVRIPRAGQDTPGPDEAPGVIDENADAGPDIGADAGRAELRALFAAASEGLSPGEREVIELSLRHKMEAGDIADVLGVSPNHAHSLLPAARGQLETCLGALLVGRAGRDECRELGSLLGDWDGKLTVPLRKRLHRHIGHCSTCTERRAAELRPAAFSGLPPLAAIAGALRTLAVPGPLKARVLALATDTGAAAAAHRAAVLHHAGSFNRAGFPRAAGAAKAGDPRAAGTKAGAFLRTPLGRGTAAALVAAIAAAAAAFALAAGHTSHLVLANPRPGYSGGGPGAAGGTGSSHGSGSGGGGSVTWPGPAQPDAAAPPRGKPGPGLAGSSSSASGGTSPRTTSPSSPAPARSSPRPTAPTAPPAPSGTLAASPDGGLLTIPPGGVTITLTNTGTAQAHWRMTVSGGSGSVQTSPASGSLAPGKSAAVKVTARSGVAAGQTITLAPGSTKWTVLAGLNGLS